MSSVSVARRPFSAAAVVLAAALACGGSQGSPGPVGPAGPRGDTGATGPKGEPGEPATIPGDLIASSRRPLDPESLAQFITPLPAIPVLTPDRTSRPGYDFYEIGAQQGLHDFGLRRWDGSPILDPTCSQPVQTVSWGYGGSYLGPTIEARSTLDPGGRKVVVRYVNGLRGPDGQPLTHHLLDVDHTIDGASAGEPDVRLVTHLHGGHTAAAYDGNPEYWFTSDPSAPANGMGGPPGNTVEYTYDNDQPAATLWYHDHAMGITRLNVYAGLAAFYLLRDDAEDQLGLPKGDYEVPLVIQDKSFHDDGSLAFDTVPLLSPYTGLPLLDPRGNPLLSSRPETFGNVIVVNGVAWPYLEVEPRRYRFRLLNGADSRFFRLWLETVGAGPQAGLAMAQIGNEGGLLPKTVSIGSGPANALLLANGERADVIVDFSAFAGKTVLLRNDAPTPFPSGDPVDAGTTGKIIAFRVTKPLCGTDDSVVPNAPRTRPALPPPALTRVVDLQELVDIYSISDTDVSSRRLELRLNGLLYHDAVTENPRLGDVEDWIIVNTTGDTHPMHLHLVQFEVQEKGSFDPALYTPGAGGDLGVLAPGALHPGVDAQGLMDGDEGFDPTYAVAENERGVRDTVKVPTGGYARIRAHFDRPGRYVWHCHILSHEDHAMMRPFEVVP